MSFLASIVGGIDLPDDGIDRIEISPDFGSEAGEVAIVGMFSIGKCGIAKSAGGGTIVVTGGIGKGFWATGEAGCMLFRVS